MLRFISRLLGATLALVTGLVQAQQPATVRVDYNHSGNALSDLYALERLLIEPLPRPGDSSRNFDNTNRGNNRVEVADAKTGDQLYRGTSPPSSASGGLPRKPTRSAAASTSQWTFAYKHRMFANRSVFVVRYRQGLTRRNV